MLNGFDIVPLTEDDINTDEERRHQADYAQARILLRLAKENLFRAVSVEVRHENISQSLLILVSATKEASSSSWEITLVNILKAAETCISLSMVSFEADAETEFIEALNILYKAKHVYNFTLPVNFDR